MSDAPTMRVVRIGPRLAARLAGGTRNRWADREPPLRARVIAAIIEAQDAPDDCDCAICREARDDFD